MYSVCTSCYCNTIFVSFSLPVHENNISLCFEDFFPLITQQFYCLFSLGSMDFFLSLSLVTFYIMFAIVNVGFYYVFKLINVNIKKIYGFSYIYTAAIFFTSHTTQV